ncbi:cytochrome c oxidase assembly protein [Gilvimarinus agarilyticus]|uniref:cytochrome c oxidase assembly protein n=1 Tax=unclassified Gilvimarinus TaxID=2642066 RepID=UPI001C08D163|nr:MULTISPECIES: cytochrome c oxidase assembly protein [unclassified Gilvimarinus]MBU2886500.1 cytochrome c oxidase assembly protein [Gilvimarinus agarilyticus]MDO6571168.1 cytochrome c oxidase assembly protein [Gilvimarinus sp. 2_MG-2023]MDO6746451.1 cytochrome c oxidase assembly protein [Gilvimarinus sp. 1_MG-2023]
MRLICSTLTLRSFLLCVVAFCPTQAFAHNPITDPTQSATVAGALMLLALWLAYGWGCLKLRPARHRCWLFNAAAILSVFTLFGPLDEWAETNAAAHMVQHMIMMVVIAPMWVVARPLPQLYALNAPIASALCAPLLLLARHSMAAAVIHGAFIWLWHTPKLYILALDNLWWHLFEHLCFLVSAGAFWWAVLRSQQRNTPAALLALLFTLMHTGFLGALLTFSQTSWYGAARPLEYQQLAGLLMWVLGGLPYFTAALWLGWRWFNRVGDKS